MELILAILGAGPIGYLTGTRKQGLLVVFSESGGGDDALYWVFNALIPGLGLGLNRLGSMLRERRRASHTAAKAS